MSVADVFGDDRVELLGGILTTLEHTPPHDFTVIELVDQMRRRLPHDHFSVLDSKPLALGRFWRPRPNIAVVRGPLRNYAARYPGRLDVALLVEVSDTTYPQDAGRKLRAYERAGIPLYWVVDLARRRVEVREMSARGLAVPVLYHEQDEIPVVIDGHDYGRLPVRDLLP
jgi:Uma2 family endonuclease